MELGALGELVALNMELCSGDGACTYLEDPVDGSRVPPYWRKVAAMRVCLAQQATRCDACLYIDTDAVLNVRRWRGLMDVRRLLGEGHFAFAPDMISVPNRLNAGVFAARNSSRAAAILDSWWFALPRDAWTREEPSGTWRCRDDEGGSSGGEQTASMQAPQAGDCLFAGRRYEQGVFNREVLHAYEDDLHEVSPVVWNNYNNRACDAGRIKHFMGVFGTWMDTSSAAPFDPERDGKQNRIAEYLEVSARARTRAVSDALGVALARLGAGVRAQHLRRVSRARRGAAGRTIALRRGGGCGSHGSRDAARRKWRFGRRARRVPCRRGRHARR